MNPGRSVEYQADTGDVLPFHHEGQGFSGDERSLAVGVGPAGQPDVPVDGDADEPGDSPDEALQAGHALVGVEILPLGHDQ